MHKQLLQYGDCYIRNTEGIKFQIYRDDPNPEPRIEYTGQQKDEAYNLHRRIIRLEIRLSLVTQVFYGESVSMRWDELQPNTQLEIINDLTNWDGYPFGVNKRLRNYGKERGLRLEPIAPWQFMGLRDRAIRILVNSGRRLP